MKSFANFLKQIFFYLKNERAIRFKKLNPVIIIKYYLKFLTNIIGNNI